MKKITLLLSGLALSCTTFGQSQRLCLAEEFTQASCPPCAAANPGYNTLLQANLTKVASIKYQTSWPGYDPMNLQNAGDVQTRVSYYAVSGVPDGKLDGVDFYPGSITQAQIDAEYAVASPYTITVSHTFSPDYSTVTYTEVITCTQAVTGNLVNHIAMVEKQIHFATQPGTNGETDFYEVMKKMYPSAAGTPVTAMTVGATQTFTATVPVPNYVYDLNQVSFVCWVQNTATKAVQQAGQDSPIVLPPSTEDAGISATTNVNAIQCATSVTPSVTVKNYAPNTLTTCTINYQLDGGAVMTQAWTGSLATNGTSVTALPTLTVGVGSHTLVSWTSQPNGGSDYHIINNLNSKTFSIIGASSMAPVVEPFVSFPPANWVIDDPNNTYPWEHVTTVGGFGTSSECTAVNFYNDPAGNIEDMYVQPTNLTTTATHATVTFDVAYCQYSTENDNLKVQVSTDCGVTWATAYNKQGATLATKPAQTASFVPTATQWRNDGADLTPYLNQANVLIRFRATSGYGNNLFVDNINIFTSNSALGIADNSANVNSMEIFPNPMKDNATVNFNLANASIVQVTMTNVLGQTVYSTSLGQMTAGDHNTKIDASNLNSGIYFVTLNVADGKITKKVSINK